MPLLAALLLTTVPAAWLAARATASRPADVHVVALGDSLAVGVQPGLSGSGVRTSQGYPRQFAARLRERGLEVKLHELGCGGATSESVLRGGRPCAPESDVPYDNEDPLTSQIAAAEGLLADLADQPVIVLVDVGGNDVGACIKGGTADPACVREAGRALAPNLEELLRRVRAAAPRAAIGLLDLYDPVLGLWDGQPSGRPTIEAVHRAFQRDVNATIAQVAGRQRVRLGELGASMRQDEPIRATDAVRPPGVDAVCELTWMCVDAPLRPDIHLRREGYGRAASVLLEALEPDLRRLGLAR